MFWVPKDAKLFSGNFSRATQSFQWLFTNPQWATNDKIVLQYLLKMRIAWAIGAVVWLIMVTGILTKK
jgi:hypothetical protein